MDLENCKHVVEYYANTKKVKIFELLLAKWIVLRELIYVLHIPYRATIALQNQQLTLSDTFGVWLKMKLHLKACVSKTSFKTNLAKYLLGKIEERNDTIFANPAMLAAIFLDPRFRNEIIHDEQKVIQAKSILLKVWRRLNISTETSFECSATDKDISSSISFEFDEQTALDDYLNRNAQIVAQNDQRTNEQIENIEEIIDSFAPGNISSTESILNYWESAKGEHPILYKLAVVILAIPSTEVQNERDFSKLNFIVNSRRNKLATKHLQDTFVIHLNQDFFYQIMDCDLS